MLNSGKISCRDGQLVFSTAEESVLKLHLVLSIPWVSCVCVYCMKGGGRRRGGAGKKGVRQNRPDIMYYKTNILPKML